MNHQEGPGSQDSQQTLVINGRRVRYDDNGITFEHLAALAFPSAPYGQNTAYTVTYKRGPKANPEGSMVEGDKVLVQNGMIFNVTATDKS